MLINGVDLDNLKYFNLSDLLVLIDNDIDTLKVLIEEFIDVAPLDIQELNEAILSSNYQSITEKAHKLKSTFKYFGINTASKLAQIEGLAKNENDLEQIHSMFENVLVDFDGALKEAKILVS